MSGLRKFRYESNASLLVKANLNILVEDKRNISMYINEIVSGFTLKLGYVCRTVSPRNG